MNLDQYRAAVVAAVGCPFCGARPGDPCLNTYGTTNPVRKLAGYVHDDRSLVYADSLEHTTMQVLERIRELIEKNRRANGWLVRIEDLDSILVDDAKLGEWSYTHIGES